MTGIFLWVYALFASAVAAATVLRALRIARACRGGVETPAARPRPDGKERLKTDLRTFFDRTLAAVLHTVLVVSFLLMLADLVFYPFRPSVPLAGNGGFYAVFSTVNAVFAAAAIAAAAVLLSRRLLPLPRYAALTPAQRRDGLAVLLLEMASAGSLLALYAGIPPAAFVHYGIMLVFGLYITFSKHLHIFLAPVYMAVFGRRETFAPDDMPEVARGLDILSGGAPASADVPGRMGARDASDLTRGRLLSAFSCTECGRCDQACPAVAVGTRFSPRQAVAGVRRTAMGGGKELLYGRAVSRDEVFACISCGACLAACPIAISPLDILLQVRRYATLEEGAAPPEYALAAANVAATGNPWGFKQGLATAETASGMPVADPEHPAEYLLWRGVMGIHDPEGRAALDRAPRLLTAAGVSWAVLPESEEWDTADILRYTGDELTFLSSARRNIATLDRYGVKNIVTTCPHSLSAFRNQYPSLGGDYRTWHLSEFVLKLSEEGKLKLRRTLEGKTAVYHDPCRLSRSQVTQAPRALLETLGAHRVEAPLHGRHSMCCGGGDYFRSDGTPAALAARRMEQLAATGADVVVTACPFCLQMLSQTRSDVPVTDLIRWLEV